MGVIRFFRDDVDYGGKGECDKVLPNPDPTNFKIIVVAQIGRNLVAKIKYPDCTNYEGQKICVYKSVSATEFCNLNTVDPHFTEGRYSPFARFKPTKEGWAAALKLAKEI